MSKRQNLETARRKRALERLHQQPMKRIAGEVRFIKDRAGDKNEWAWGTPGPTTREITPEYKFNASKLKPLAQTLRALLSAMGHAMSGYSTLTKIKSATISPDGAIGGKGYIMKIAEMRRQLTNVVEVLSSVTDTLYDELHAPHWNPAVEEQSPRERDQVLQIMEDVDDIREDPEEWAEEEEGESFNDSTEVDPVSGKKPGKKSNKMASSLPLSGNVASRYLNRGRKVLK